MTVLGDFFSHEQFKMELMTVITSPPGSGDQRWHQGWRYLFHPDERLPPFAAVHSASCTVGAAALVLHRASPVYCITTGGTIFRRGAAPIESAWGRERESER